MSGVDNQLCFNSRKKQKKNETTFGLIQVHYRILAVKRQIKLDGHICTTNRWVYISIAYAFFSLSLHCIYLQYNKMEMKIFR